MVRDQVQKRDRELRDQGWVRRFNAEEPRVWEMKELYEALGLEVVVEDFALPEEGQECTGCLETSGFSGPFKTIYTRGPEKSGTSSEEDLFD
ncbi:hypothetical protein ACFL2Q_12245 [Thermodesulfobacteriota bacterium]